MSQARLYQHPLFYSFMNKICGYSLLLDEKQGRESIVEFIKNWDRVS